jgi:hypothetical protein
MSAPFQKFIIGGSSGEGSKEGGGAPLPLFSENLLKLCENCRKWDCYYIFFYILELLFKLSGSKPLKKQNKQQTLTC